MNRELVEKYFESYPIHIKDEDIRKNEKKKIHNLLAKLNNPQSIYKGLSFSCLNVSEQVRLLHFILEEIEERQIISNLSKIDADKDYRNLIIDKADEKGLVESFYDNEMTNYEPIDINSMLISNRKVIRSEQDINFVLDYLYFANEKIIRLLMDEINTFYMMGYQFEYITYIMEYIDYISNDIMQLIVYKIIRNSDMNTASILHELSNEVRCLSDKLDVQLDKKRKEQKSNNTLVANQVMRYFSAYLRHRSKLKVETDIYKELEKEVKQSPAIFDPVREEYTAPKIILSEKEIKKATMIITEGESIYRYNEKLSTVRKFIDMMRIYDGRQCYSNCLLDLKVYFREIYISKAIYKRQQTHKIVEDYIKKINSSVEYNKMLPEFDKKSQYIFVREKISRGYFREKGLLGDYYEKTAFTSEFYDLLLKIYWFCDYKDGLTLLYKINSCLINKVQSLIDL